jgi:hypothetical protein
VGASGFESAVWSYSTTELHEQQGKSKEDGMAIVQSEQHDRDGGVKC